MSGGNSPGDVLLTAGFNAIARFAGETNRVFQGFCGGSFDIRVLRAIAAAGNRQRETSRCPGYASIHARIPMYGGVVSKFSGQENLMPDKSGQFHR